MCKMEYIMNFLLFMCVFSAAYGNEGSAPVIKEQPSSVIARRNDPATLNCAASGNAHITWYRDGQKVVTSPQDSRSHRVLLPSGSLFFLRVTSGRRDSDAGTYWCVASNKYGTTRSKNATLTVAYLSYDFQAYPESEAKVLVGDLVSFSCKAPKGSPEPKLSWLKNSEEIMNSSHITVTESGDLLIQKALEQDSGTYSCRARNIAGSRESPPTKLEVMVPPYFDKIPKNVTAPSGAKVEFYCQAMGHPPPSITWRRLNGKMPKTYRTNDNYELVLEEVEASDSGVYVCEAESNAGFSEVRVFLTVFDAPQITQRPQNTQVLSGKKAKLSCSIEGDPIPLLLWRLPAQDRTALLTPLQTSGHISVSSDGQTMSIISPTTRDSGTYQCWGISNGGGVSAKAELMVVEAYPPPVIGVGPQDLIVKPGSDISFPCEVVSEAASPKISWWYQPAAHIPSRKLNEENGNSRISLPNTGALLLKDVQSKDAGIYTCRVEAETGSIEQEAILQVEESVTELINTHPPAPPSKPRLLSVNETAVYLSWMPNSQRNSDVNQWYLIEHWQQEWDEWRVAAADIKNESITIKDLTPGTTYFFFVRAVSDEGKSFPSPWSDSIITQPSRDPKLTVNQIRNIRRRLSRPTVILTSADITSSSSVALEWSYIASADDDSVEGILIYAVSGSGSVQVATVLGSSSSSHQLHNLQQYTNYTFFVVPFWHNIEGTPSNSLSLTTPEDVPLSAPSDVHVILQNDGSTLITWSSLASNMARGSIIGYNVVITNNGTQTTETVKSPRLEAHGLVPGRLYTVRVAAVTGAGSGPYSSPVLMDGGMKVDHTNQNASNKKGEGASVLYAQPQPAWLVYLLVPLVIILFFATIIYIRRLRHKIPAPKPSQASSVYQDPSLYPGHHTINMYSEQKMWPSSDSDKESSLSSSKLLRSDQQINDYSEPRIQRIDEATEPYATTALLGHESPHLIHGPPWRHHSDDSGVQVNWSAILPPPPSCPPPHDLDLGDPIGFNSPRDVHLMYTSGSSHRNSMGGSEQYNRPHDGSSDHTYDVYTQMTPNTFRNGFRTFSSLQSCDCKQPNKDSKPSLNSSVNPSINNTH